MRFLSGLASNAEVVLPKDALALSETGKVHARKYNSLGGGLCGQFSCVIVRAVKVNVLF